jgi:hypothetical protein
MGMTSLIVFLGQLQQHADFVDWIDPLFQAGDLIQGYTHLVKQQEYHQQNNHTLQPFPQLDLSTFGGLLLHFGYHRA